MTATIVARVDAGVAFCDRTWPGGLERIDLDRFDLAMSYGCMLGQLHENGYGGATALYATGPTWAADQGFETGDHEHEADELAEKAALEAEWRRRILARREMSSARVPREDTRADANLVGARP